MTSEIKASVEDSKGKRAAILGMLNSKSLLHSNRAYFLYIPKVWIRLYGWELDGKVWVKIEQDMDKLVISPVDKEDAKRMMEVNNVGLE